VDSARPTAAANHIDVEVVLSPIAAPISGDPVRLQQVVTNLLTNSLKFTPPDGHVVVRLAQEGARAVLTVTDSGSGIRPEALPFVFERFRQASIADSPDTFATTTGPPVMKSTTARVDPFNSSPDNFAPAAAPVD
jgi:signal transduction histidine kinase